MKSNAPGQLLGYTLQLPRALYHLLRCGPGDVVCVEVLGDVSTHTSDSNVITEEDKSSIVGNPLTDRSTDLWKTFSNWIEAINNGDLDVRKTKFILYCNQSGRRSIVDEFSSAQNQPDAQKAIDYAKIKLNDIGAEHDIWKYYDNVINQHETLLLDVVERFELQVGNNAGYDEVRYEIQRKHVPDTQIEFLMDKLSGWLQKEISEKIAARKQAVVSWEEFNHQFLVLIERIRKRELIDFTLEYPPSNEEVQKHVKTHPCYLKQLDIIGSSDDELIKAVIDFLKANVNRQNWIECEIIDEDIASDFESKLSTFWKNQRKRIKLTESKLSEDEQGQLLYTDCKSRQETIRGMSPPESTIAGTYHTLANEPVLGWHPNWEKSFSKQKEE
jgi:hypothetical protein